MRLYVASSWRNLLQPDVVKALREAGHEVYDFRNPEPGNHGFAWSEVDPDWRNWTPEKFLAGLGHPTAERGFELDMKGLNWSEGTVLVLPSGRSAHLEAGYAAGQGKPVFILLDPMFEPELMYKMAATIVTSIPELLKALADFNGRIPQHDAGRMGTGVHP